jgi:hypothetical protein
MTGNKYRNDVSSIPQIQNRQRTNPPNNITIYKGEFHSILTRDFIQSIQNDSLVKQIWSFLNGTSVPDEHFYPTLVHLQHLPGGKERRHFFYPYYQLISHYKIWKNHNPFQICQSNTFNQGICQFNYKDLFSIQQSGKLFANKFNQEQDLISIYCWQQWINIKQTFHLDIQKQIYFQIYPFTQTNLSLNQFDIKEYQQIIKYIY